MGCEGLEMTIFWVDSSGTILGASSDDGAAPPGTAQGIYDGTDLPPPGSISGPSPESGKQRWTGVAWSPPPPTPVAPLDAEELAEILIVNAGRSLTRADIDAKKAAR